jgi:tRNA(Ile)-lysidine synthase
MNDFESVLERNLGSWPRGTVLLAAVSGGADSTAMLAGLCSLRERKGFTLRCIHVNHGIRPPEENSADEGAVRALCGALGVPCTVARVRPGLIALKARRWGEGLEAAARKFRHAALRREARSIGASRILIAHTRDDSLEKVLMAMLRGGGPSALALMPRERGGIVRPLVTLTRSQVLDYLAERGLAHCSDSTNADTAYLRNRVRLALMPLLDVRFPGWRKALFRLGKTQALIASALDRAVEKFPWKRENRALTLPEQDFFSLDQIVREEVLFRGIDSLGVRARRESIRLFAGGKLQSVDLERRGKRFRRTYRLERKNNSIVLGVVQEGSSGFALVIEKSGQYRFRGLDIEVREVPAPAEAAGVAPVEAATPAGAAPAGAAASSGVFFAEALPLVIRKTMSGDEVLYRGKLCPPAALPGPGKEREIAAVLDRKGIAACFTLAGGDIKDLLYRRDTKEFGDTICVRYSGGFNG